MIYSIRRVFHPNSKSDSLILKSVKGEALENSEITKSFGLVKNRFCVGQTEHYESLVEAKIACWMNDDCWSVYNEKCEESSGFKLCTSTPEEKISLLGSCVHLKYGK